MQDTEHLAALGIEVGEVKYDREKVAAHARNLANTVKGNLEKSLIGLDVEVIEDRGVLVGGGKIKGDQTGKVYTAKVGGGGGEERRKGALLVQ